LAIEEMRTFPKAMGKWEDLQRRPREKEELIDDVKHMKVEENMLEGTRGREDALRKVEDARAA